MEPNLYGLRLQQKKTKSKSEVDMRIFIISSRGDCLTLAKRLKDEGNNVHFYVRDKKVRKRIEDELNIVESPTADMMISDLIIIEDHESGKFVDHAKNLKRLVLGGGSMADRLVKDIDFNEDSLVGCGLKLAEEKTEGIIVEVGSWFNGEQFLRPHFIGFKYYRLGSGNIGPFTKGSGIVGIYKIKSRLFNEVLRPVETLFKTFNYIGYASIEGFVNNAHFHAIKIHSKLLYPTLNLLTEMHSTWSPFLLKLATRKAEVTAIQPDKIGVGIGYFSPMFFQEPLAMDSKLFCGFGNTIEEAKSKAYKSANRANLPKEGYYRMDIGDEFTFNMKQLENWSWM